MAGRVFTHALWRVRQGREREFEKVWSELARLFSALPRPPIERGTLLRSATDPLLYVSFGPWRSAEDVAAMRSNPRVQQTMVRLRELCTEATPDLYRIVSEVVLPL